MAETRMATSDPASTLVAGIPLADLEEALSRATSALSGARAVEAKRVLDRWRGRRFQALILGEFKRGKSTLLNALIGEDLLPTGVQPVTALPTRVRSGPERRAVVCGRDGGEREIPIEGVRDYVDESRNPGNRRDAASAEIELPAGPPPGVVLIDVPGSGSVHRHNTETALAAIPEADAALVVASVDPPVGDAELSLLKTVCGHAARVDVVINKVDYLSAEDREAALDFTRRTLAREGYAMVRVWPVSARDGLRARESGDELAWRRSGMQALADGLGRFFEQERIGVLARSLARKAGRVVEQESALLEMERVAALHSAEKLRAIIETFRARRTTASRDADERALVFRRRFDSIFAGYAERAAHAWRARRDELQSRLRAMLSDDRGLSRRATHEAMQAVARDAVGRFLDAFLPEEKRHVAAAYAALQAEVDQAAVEESEAVWRQAAELLPFDPPHVDPPSRPPAPGPAGFQLGSPHLLLDDLLDAAARLLPRGAARRRLAARAGDEADARYGQAVEQSREAFRRAYEEHFRTVLGSFGESSTQAARAVAAALEAAEKSAHGLDAERRVDGPAEQSRRAELRALRARLRQIEGEAPPPEAAGPDPAAFPTVRCP